MWGKVKITRCRYRCTSCGSSLSCWLDRSLDESGCLPEVLLRAHEASLLLPYRQASKWLEKWGVKLSPSKVRHLSEKMNEEMHKQGSILLGALADQPLVEAVGKPRRWIIEIDGKFVPVRIKKAIEWREVKSVVLYPMVSPSERYYSSYLGKVEIFSPRVHGLLRHAGIAQEDKLIGVSDGAKWIEGIMEEVGVVQHILDVYHAGSYFEVLLKGLGWEEEACEQERRSLLCGEINIGKWLEKYANSKSEDLSTEAKAAFSYLYSQAQKGHTAYPEFRDKGYEVIGSGQIEGANKAVIGARLNISGANWSEQGASNMAFARSEYYSYRSVTNFSLLRHTAFPSAYDFS